MATITTEVLENKGSEKRYITRGTISRGAIESFFTTLPRKEQFDILMLSRKEKIPFDSLDDITKAVIDNRQNWIPSEKKGKRGCDYKVTLSSYPGLTFFISNVECKTDKNEED